jgi:hypothetical protein
MTETTTDTAAHARRRHKDRVSAAFTRLHRAVFDASKGRIFGTAFEMPVVKLVTIGRKRALSAPRCWRHPSRSTTGSYWWPSLRQRRSGLQIGPDRLDPVGGR